jgi:hypothetical protein
MMLYGRVAAGNSSMKKQDDFFKGVRGKFYRPNTTLKIPVYLDKEVQTFVQGIAESKKSDVATVVNELLKLDMRLVEVIR